MKKYTLYIILCAYSVMCYSDFLLSTCLIAADQEKQIRNHFLWPEVDTLPISDWKNPTFEDYQLLQDRITKNFTFGIKRHLLDQTEGTVISNWEHPSAADCAQLQHILHTNFARTTSVPSHLKCFGNNNQHDDYVYWWTLYRLGRCKIIDTKENMPSYNIIYFNDNPEKKDQCIVCYMSYPMPGSLDRSYPRGIEIMVAALKASNFDGHLMYCIGGWPNLQKERLKYCDVPYAFKPFLVEQARDLGYKKVLWLDIASIPVRNIQPIFNHIEKNGCCFFVYGERGEQKLIDYGYVFRSLGLTKQNKIYPIIGTQTIGFDLTNEKASLLLDWWIKAAEKKTPFLTPEPDQFVFSVLVNELNLHNGRLPDSYLMFGTRANFTAWKRNKNCVIYHQYDFLDPQYQVPNNLFI